MLYTESYCWMRRLFLRMLLVLRMGPWFLDLRSMIPFTTGAMSLFNESVR